MKVYGYSSDIDVEQGPLPMSEVSFLGDPVTLRATAKFLQQMAEEVEKNDHFEHGHLRDAWDGWKEEFPDVIVCNAALYGF
jgi:hypothetical protein